MSSLFSKKPPSLSPASSIDRWRTKSWESESNVPPKVGSLVGADIIRPQYKNNAPPEEGSALFQNVS